MAIERIPFAVSSDEAVSKAYSRQRLLNLYAELPQGQAKSPVLILGRWGLKPWTVAGSGPVRGSTVMSDTLYVVSGSELYSVTSAGVATLAGGAISGTGFVVMANNGFQLAIATDGAWVDYLDEFFIWGRNGTTGKAYLYNHDTASFGQISDPDLFLSGTGKFQISAVGDGANYDGLDFATAEASPDDLIRGLVDRADLFLFGTDTTEPWYISGAQDFPFARQNQTVIPKGILGTHLVARLDNTVLWVGRDPEAGGGAIVYRLNGIEPLRVSTHAVESDLNSVSDWSLVRCISYTLNGHAFFHIVLSDRNSWVYDCATRLWHEEGTFGLSRWAGNSHSYVYGTHVVGRYDTGALYQLTQDYYFDGASTQIEREAISVPLGTDEGYKRLARFQLDMETGVGLTTGQGFDPQVMAAYSLDRGRTWSNEKWRSFGKVGQYGLRVIWRNWGRFRSIMIKLRITDPVKVAFIDYFADIV